MPLNLLNQQVGIKLYSLIVFLIMLCLLRPSQVRFHPGIYISLTFSRHPITTDTSRFASGTDGRQRITHLTVHSTLWLFKC